jgi:hypothetical protein
MKTGSVAIVAALLLTGGALAIANKACKTNHHSWCARSLFLNSGKALNGGGRTRARMTHGAPADSALASDLQGAAKLSRASLPMSQ